MGRETLGKVRDGLGEPHGGLGQVKGASGLCGTSRGNLPEVQDWLEDCWGVWDGSATFGVVWDGSGAPRGVPGRVGVPSVRSDTGQETLGVVRNGSQDPRGVPGRVKRPLGRSGTGRRTLSEVRDGSRRSGTGWGTLG